MPARRNCHARFSLALPLLLAACGATSAGTTADLSGPAGGNPDLALPLCLPHAVKCTDNQVQDLPLYKKISTRKIESASDGKGGFTAHIDASGGGMSATESFVYVKFGAAGLVKVDVGDEGAFNSTEWDLGFRRFVIRLNSGVSGPGCVTAARIDGSFDALATLPAAATLEAEAYYDGNCTLVPDQSGLGTAGTRLSDFWTYQMCVEMTGQLYVIALGDGRLVKLEVTSYYEPALQDTCNTTHTVPGGTAGGQLRFRWAPIAK